ncbi:MAG: hypothetical protein A2X05_16100 [Bacteroidetes bacterium GWE2_41_25]|nr:MAG: hypothetical protein A2X05_16100 [Bacteroidetes bacterium GWE2_41_25]
MAYLLKLIALFNLILIAIPMTAQNQTREFKLALVQMYVTPGDLLKNLSHATQLITEAAAGGANVVLLPEVMDLGWTHPSAKELAGIIPGGKAFNTLANAAKKQCQDLLEMHRLFTYHRSRRKGRINGSLWR